MANTPADAEKTTTPPGGGEPTQPVEETETISKAELSKLRNIAGTTERVIKERDEVRAQLAAQEAKAQLETLVLQVAEANKVDPNLLMKYAPKRTKEELEELAKDFPKVGEKAKQGLALNSVRSSGGNLSLGSLAPKDLVDEVFRKLRAKE